MANADELCQFARLGQTSKIQKCLQTHSVDINALNLYGESALSTATYHNQILSVEYLLVNRADPKLRLSAGHTAVHIACRLANIPVLHMLLSIKANATTEEEEQQQRRQKKEDKHIYDCLKIEDNAHLTPVHWAGTQESVSKRQKLFAFLDQRMPGVLDSRYNINWFKSWAKTHPWVIEQKSTKDVLSISPIRPGPKLTNTAKTYRHYYEQGSSLPLTTVTPLDMMSRTSLHNYEHTPIYDDDEVSKSNRLMTPKREDLAQVPNLPLTPNTSRIVTSINPILKRDHKTNETSTSPKSFPVNSSIMTATPQKTPYSQRLSSMIKHSFSPQSDRSTYRAERAHVIPTFTLPSTLINMEIKTHRGHDYEDILTPISSKRPSHNLLSNIVPSNTTPSSDHSSHRSSKPFASFGFDTSIDPRPHNDTTTPSTIETDTPIDEGSFVDGEDHDYESNQFDYLCKSASTLGVSSTDTDSDDL